jgi:hypothetical protein
LHINLIDKRLLDPTRPVASLIRRATRLGSPKLAALFQLAEVLELPKLCQAAGRELALVPRCSSLFRIMSEMFQLVIITQKLDEAAFEGLEALGLRCNALP